MTKNEADEKINPVARNETETETEGRGEERMMEILGQQQGEEEEEKWKESKRGWSEGDRGADMLSQECCESCSFIIHLHGKRSFTY